MERNNKKQPQQIIEDEIGPKMLCFMCSSHFYYFQYSDHVQNCMKTQHFYPSKIRDIESVEKQELDIEKKERFEYDDREKEEDKKEEEVNPRAKEWLSKFQQMKQNVSKVYQKSRIQESKVRPVHPGPQEPKRQEFTQLPCPFCGQILPLTDLSHIDNCSRSQRCKYCKDKYPKSLITSHWKVCQKKKQNNKNNENISKEEKFVQPPMRFANQKQPENNKQRFRKFDPVPSDRHHQPYYERPRREEILNPRQYQEESMMREANLKGLSQRQINSLTWSLYIPKENGEPDECTICCQNLQLAEEQVSLPCRHLFHKECLLPWLQQRSTCPTCKGRVVD